MDYINKIEDILHNGNSYTNITKNSLNKSYQQCTYIVHKMKEEQLCHIRH